MRKGTFWRVYLHGLGLLVLVGLAIFVVGQAFGPPHGRSPERFGRWVARTQEPYLDDPAELQRRLVEIHETIGGDIAVYRTDGSILASVGEPPPLPEKPRQRRKRVEPGEPVVVRMGQDAWLVMAPPRWAGEYTRPAAILGSVLVVLALGSIPLARSIASPLERLTRTVRRFGAGDLSARTGMRGSQSSEAGQLAVAFDEMADRIERLVRGEKELLANVSHELRTPLARIRIALELAEEGDRNAGRYLKEIEKDLAELERLIEDVFTAVRLDLAGSDGTPPMRVSEHPAGAILEGAAQRFRAVHPDRRLDERIEGALPMLACDEALLRRALANLLDNAAKYSDEAIELRARVEAGALVIEVADRGIGIAPEEVPHLFEPFFRTDRSRARGSGGVGLGLTLTRRIVEAHGGRIGVSSRPGTGTTFRIDLPL